MSSFRNNDDRYSYNNTGEYRRRGRGKGIRGIMLFAALLFAAFILFKGWDAFSPLFNREQVHPKSEEASAIQTAVQESANVAGNNRYFRRQLGGDYQLVYDRILSGLQNHLETIELEIDDREKLTDIYNYVIWDYPELFWANLKYSYSYSTLKGFNTVKLSPEYQLSAEEQSTRSAYVADMVESAASQFQGLSDYEKVKGVYEYVINSTVYDSAYTGKSCYELFSEGRAVCEGYARATQYILLRLGIEAVYTVGYATNAVSGENHAWLKVPIDGEYYNVDTTWGDPNNPDGEQLLSHAYLCASDADISATHFPDPNPYPPCTATQYNYYVAENRLLSTYDEQLLLLWFAEDFAAGKNLEFRAINDDVYQQTLKTLFDGRRYFDITSQIRGFNTNSCSYSQIDTMRVINISY